MNQHFQDAMAVAQHYQGFDLFITFTCNTHWAEIQNELLPGQSAADHPDLTVHMFNMYKMSLVHEIMKNNIFGITQGYVYTIEFQKCRLPHMHMLLSVSPRFHLTTAEEVDTIIRAMWPDPEREPLLFNIVKHCMVHGPCGPAKPHTPCMRDGKCSKGFPKPFQNKMIMTRNGYPLYAHPNDGRSYEVRNFFADNRWIVLYNPYILSW
jgi:Helitron helicase-like domain at N-terminus